MDKRMCHYFSLIWIRVSKEIVKFFKEKRGYKVGPPTIFFISTNMLFVELCSLPKQYRSFPK